ncbi:hypothetical protein RhiirA4_539416 [Rhizophagus irregularis]|uniref:Uncharacterized protein n=1 Tax=Rhizophagus irregularis TaxID=588596 RepID=A0A2I1G3K1_9GLOM|nr:hypothetical protein RhiirA4_539416 [Rhizophagus irregularis]
MEIALNCIFLGNCYAFSVKVCYINVIGDKAHVNSQLMTQRSLKVLLRNKLEGVELVNAYKFNDYFQELKDYKDHGKIHIIVHVPAAAAAGPFQRGVPQDFEIEFVKDLPYPPIGNGPDIDVGIGQTSVALRVLYEYFTSGGNYDYGEFVKMCKNFEITISMALKGRFQGNWH